MKTLAVLIGFWLGLVMCILLFSDIHVIFKVFAVLILVVGVLNDYLEKEYKKETQDETD